MNQEYDNLPNTFRQAFLEVTKEAETLGIDATASVIDSTPGERPLQ